MQILVLATDYSRPDGYISSHYIHSRNKSYKEQGIEVSVLSFASKIDYEFEGIKVYSFKTYEKRLKNIRYDLLLSHAPNLRNHYKFLKKYDNKFENIIFYFHGHEVLKTSEIYPEPYPFNKNQYVVKNMIRKLYDIFKLTIWKRYFQRITYKSQFIFVSNWMYEMFIKFVGVDPIAINNRKHIIYNCVGKEFESIEYDEFTEKKYDFITIRNNIDGSKYGIDIVTRLAENNPNFKFCVVGKGEFYNHNKRPENLDWMNKNLSHDEIVEFLNMSKCALLPTRADAQGVMACEMATFGIPLITSDIDVCKEVFEGFYNVAFINNNSMNIDISHILKKLLEVQDKGKNKRYFSKNTVGKEIELFRKILDWEDRYD